MGIEKLFPFISKYSQKVHLSQFSGQTAAIDASCWIHKALCVSLSQSGNRERLRDIFQANLRSVVRAGVTPFVVFDGLPLPAKAKENERRRRDREKLQNKADDPNISTEEANKLRGKSVSINFDDVSVCINICLDEKVRYIVSPYESDAQIAFLLCKGLAHFAITEDSDLLAYGCNKVVVKTSLNGEGECFSLTEILEGLKLNRTQFQHLCIAAGCDYLKNVSGIGIHRAYNFIQKGALMNSLAEKGATKEYQQYFYKVEAVLKHQTVFDWDSCSTVPLEKWENIPPKDVQHLCGDNLEDAFSRDFAAGNISPQNGKKVNSYPLFVKVFQTGQRDQGAATGQDTEPDGDGESYKPMEIQLIHLDRFTSFKWKVPCFPVLTLEFVQVCFKVGNEINDGVIQKSCAGGIQRGMFVCKQHCEIDISGRKYTVLWKLEPKKAGPPPPPTVRPSTSAHVALPGNNEKESDEDDDDDEEEEAEDVNERVHTLPFKVLGTCHSISRQEALQEAFNCLYEQNEPVSTKLEAEPSNPFDSQAIAVYIKTAMDYKKVGYLARELTRFVHPLLRSDTLTVSVSRICFCATYLMVGFYLTIEISKRGLWDQEVVMASRRVK